MNLTFEFNLKESDYELLGNLMKEVMELRKELARTRKEMKQ